MYYFQSDCKIAKLKPLYKKGSKTNSENFRPISLLPLISKIIERMVFDQVDNFLLQNTILYNQHLGKTVPPTSASLSSMTKY